MDMFTMALKGMGFDPEAIVGQAKQLGAAFEAIVKTQATIIDNQTAILDGQASAQASLDMLTGHFGLYVAPPTPDVMRIIESESQRFLTVASASQ